MCDQGAVEQAENHGHCVHNSVGGHVLGCVVLATALLDGDAAQGPRDGHGHHIVTPNAQESTDDELPEGLGGGGGLWDNE